MGSISDAVEALNNLLSMPAVRICALAVSLASLFVSLWALRKTNLAVRTFRSNVLAEHARFLESQWVSIYQLTLTHDKFASYVAEMFNPGLSGNGAKRCVAADVYQCSGYDVQQLAEQGD